ncbi:uncharacterized protein LOC111829506 [Capsella rubella]|uniref:uncharacterized protein LOC111829506 n=1 Tax=Capsella rubella TaxID=81985 RepID=UPI000CD4C0CC|nr:uncharacterized protein LOC111829506 [Capsella rubella]
MTRLLLELITLEKQAGNSRGKTLSEKGKENVLIDFKNHFPITLTWNKIKNRLDTLKRQYEIYPSRLRSHPLRFLPLLDVVFRDETVVVEESWQPRRGVRRHTPVVGLNDSECTNNNGEETDDLMRNHDERGSMETQDPNWMSEIPRESSVNLGDVDLSFASQERSSTHTQVNNVSRNNVSRNRKRKQNPVDSTLDRIAATMEERNDILEQMTNAKSQNQSTNSTEERMALVVKYVRAVPDLVPMTELYWACLDLIATNDVVRGLFLTLPDDEKLPFLKRQTKESCNDFFDA